MPARDAVLLSGICVLITLYHCFGYEDVLPVMQRTMGIVQLS